ncbi:hypothetical protein [Opitutus terrae]|uniref:DUF2383 domain-containing protein n=1 Tax=Opitutus terrae (strain DSM 11246 / JCM 15787 / PB90-1) TaxID=452637 RepID=B1ZPJ3_OPITP|nr:hypothetical protein [Opitutus terrae]ACB74512.1 hypothetical protein Oter_1227 [Opitutus terrae PB90-1]
MQTNPHLTGSGQLGPQCGPSAAIPSGYGTLLHEERQLQAVVREGIAQAEGFGGRRLADLLRYQRDEVAAIINLLVERTQQLPIPARFRATDADQAAHPRSLRPVGGSGTGHQVEQLHAELAERFVRLTSRTVALNADRFFGRLSRRHHKMAGKLHDLFEQRPRIRQISDRDRGRGSEQSAASASHAVWENEGGSPMRGTSAIAPSTTFRDRSSLPE